MGFASQPPAWRMTLWGTIPHAACTTVQKPVVAHHVPDDTVSPVGLPHAFTKQGPTFAEVLRGIAHTDHDTGTGATSKAANQRASTSSDPSVVFRTMLARTIHRAPLRAASIIKMPPSAYGIEPVRTAQEVLRCLLTEADETTFFERIEAALALAHLYSGHTDAAPVLQGALEKPDVIARASSVFIGTLHNIYVRRAQAREEYSVLVEKLVPALWIVWPLIDGEHSSIKKSARSVLKEIAEDMSSATAADLAGDALKELFSQSSHSAAVK